MRLTRAECASRYGQIIDGKWADEAKHCVTVYVPELISKVCVNTLARAPWTRVYCNRAMARPLSKALQNVIDRGVIHELQTFDGCYNVRMIRGSKTELSAHAWALAIDLNAQLNPLGRPSAFSPEFVKCFTDEEWIWGGSFERLDAQHFSIAGF